ncbi:MAG: hypothetical protein KTR31_03870 [Myxococcales bacterium]|nr:hypothetical protein [Myxococcales bacterium]
MSVWWLMACSAPTSPQPKAPSTPAPPPRRLALQLPAALEVPLPCDVACPRAEAVRVAVARGIDGLDAASREPDVHTNLDVLIALHEVRSVFASQRLDALWARVLPELDSGGDPRRRFWDASHRMPPEFPGHTWTPDPAQKVSPNRLLVEALYCPEHGFRSEVGAYACQVFRDDGGLMSAHAAWGLAVAVDGGCIEREATCLDEVRDELVAAALANPPLTTTREVDAHAEQLVFALMAGAAPTDLAAVVDRLLAAQGSDGAWAVPTAGEDPWWGMHATLAALWGTSAWVQRRTAP